MNLEFDVEKDAANLEKHGVSLRQAAGLDLSTALVLEDERRSYGERRYLAFGPIGGRCFALAFTLRDDKVRAISLRPVNRKERKRYGLPTL